LPRYAGPVVGVAAVVLYHFANPSLLTSRYREADIVQIVLFLAVGIVAAVLADDRDRLRRLAITDDLTGLHNLRGFEAKLNQMIRVAREANAPVSLLVLDVDRLKSINDTHGHTAGADAVRTVGHVIAAHLPRDACACRFGGDEFVVALKGKGIDETETVARTLRDAVHSAAPTLAGVPFPAGTLSISVGVACHTSFDGSGPAVSPVNADVGESLFRAADRALYLAKDGGRNRVRRVSGG
jgi:diguanylate cyclase (GGDEF)-like protein